MAMNRSSLDNHKNLLAQALTGISADKLEEVNRALESVALEYYDKGRIDGLSEGMPGQYED